MIVDVSLFYNEFDIADIRINELGDTVDRFVFIVGDRTFQGNPNHWVNDPRMDELEKRVDVLYYSVPEKLVNFGAEHWLRARALDVVGEHSADDLFLLTDADEIIRPGIVGDIDSNYNLTVDQYYYKFTNYMRKQSCPVAFLGGKSDAPYSMRFGGIYPTLPDAGWEFSFFGGADFIQHKLESYSHSELVVPEYHDRDRIQYRIDNDIDIVDRPKSGEPSIPLPDYVLGSEERFRGYF